MSASMYIGITRNHGNVVVPHTTYNVLVTETTKVKIVYQNRTDVNKMHFHCTFDTNETGAAETDVTGLPGFENYGLEIDSNMQEYEWSVLTLEVPTSFAGLYLGKTILQFEGSQIAIRAVSIETGV